MDCIQTRMDAPPNALPRPVASVLLSHPTGNQNSRNALRSLAEHGMLAEFWTAIAWNVESRWNRLVPRGLSQELARRAFTDAPQGKVKCAPSREIVRLAVRSSPLERFLCSAERPFSTIGTYRHLDRVVARHLREARADAVYAYEGGGLQTFKAAERQGIGTLCEVQSSHWRWWRDLLSKEAECNPEFAGLLPRMADLSRHFAEKDEELQLADVVVVPSRHVRQTLAGVVPDKKIRVIPYGAPPVRVRERPVRDVRMPLKVLFVGLLSQSKGIGYLLDALKMLGSMVDVTLVGRRLSAHPRVDEACARWRWFESLPHAGVLERMQTADVLVLPSLAEGCSLVVLEALSCGLPVIVTPNSGTLEVVRDGREGFVVPVCRADAIAERLDTLAADRELLAGMSRNAQATAATHQWEAYRETWAETVRLPWR